MEDKIITGITALIGLCTMLFGMSQDVASELQKAVPQVVGGVMAIVSVVAYLRSRQADRQREYDKKSQVFSAMVYQNAPETDNAVRSPEAVERFNEHIAKAAKTAFGIDIDA